MKKKIRLTESDLMRLVKKVLRETSDNPRSPFAYNAQRGKWIDADDFEIDDPSEEMYSQEKEFGPDEYEDFMEYINDCDTQWCLKTKKFYDVYASRPGLKIRK